MTHGAPRPRTVVFYPRFESQNDFNNHYHRACWYLPRVPGTLDRAMLAASAPFRRELRPSYMCPSRLPVDHIEVELDEFAYECALATADLILCWKNFADCERELAAARVRGRLLNVDTHDVDAVEFGSYGKVHWLLVPIDDRRAMLAEHHRRFRAFIDKVQAQRPRAAVVFGTGPSIDRAFEFDFSGLFTVVCNTAVQSDRLLEHIRPTFVCAGDVVSHLGVSAYAARFRDDLAAALLKFDLHFLTTAQFGWLLCLQYPEIADRVFLCDQTSKDPVFDLCRRWALPLLDSTLNIHMLPLAATVCDRIYILGCDGKNPDPKKNEDFWAHSVSAQYHDLVETGHLSHPTFDARRRRYMHARFLDSVAGTIERGESRHGKSYFSLAPSFTPSLSTRLASPDLVAETAGQLKHLV